jgi:hypothetical protein
MEVEPTLGAPFSYCGQGRAREASSYAKASEDGSTFAKAVADGSTFAKATVDRARFVKDRRDAPGPLGEVDSPL